MICSKIEDNITTDVDWLNRVNQSNITHRTIIQRKLQTRKPNELFLKDKGRYTIKASMISEFSIIPWLLPPIVESQRRESLSSKKGETIEIVTAALNFLWNEVLDEEDYEYLKQYYLINGCPKRILWGIVSAKSHLETFRLNRMNKSNLKINIAYHII